MSERVIPALLVRCPLCCAISGFPCKRGGMILKVPHKRRTKLASHKEFLVTDTAIFDRMTAAEAKVAELTATIAKEESRSNELAKEVAILRVDLRAQAATIERLTAVIKNFPPEHRAYCTMVVKNDPCTCGLDAALSKQEPTA